MKKTDFQAETYYGSHTNLCFLTLTILQDDYSDLYNWEAHSNVVYGPNNCTSETVFSNWGSSVQTQQSPIIASDNPFWACNDRHTTHDYVSDSHEVFAC